MADSRLILAAVLSAVAVLASLVGLLSLFRAHRRARLKSDPPGDAAPDGTAAPQPYRRVEALLSPNERLLYPVLRAVAEAEGVDLFAKVHLEALVQVRKGAADYQVQRKRVSACYVAFLLCERDRLQPLLALELESSAHSSDSRRERDEFLAQALAAVELPLLRLPVQASYEREEIASLVRGQLAGLVPAPPRTPPRQTTSFWLPTPLAALPANPDSPRAEAPGSEMPLAGEPETASSEAPPMATADALEAEQPANEEGDGSAPPAAPPTEADPETGEGQREELPPHASLDTGGESPVAVEVDDAAAAVDVPLCPACGEPLFEMQDIESGEVVLACSRYPDCPHVQAPLGGG